MAITMPDDVDMNMREKWSRLCRNTLWIEMSKDTLKYMVF